MTEASANLEPAIAALAFTSALTISSEASFDLAIAADAFMSALTIVPSAICVDVILPLLSKYAFVTTS